MTQQQNEPLPTTVDGWRAYLGEIDIVDGSQTRGAGRGRSDLDQALGLMQAQMAVTVARSAERHARGLFWATVVLAAATVVLAVATIMLATHGG